jgi:hypothetical protein
MSIPLVARQMASLNMKLTSANRSFQLIAVLQCECRQLQIVRGGGEEVNLWSAHSVNSDGVLLSLNFEAHVMISEFSLLNKTLAYLCIRQANGCERRNHPLWCHKKLCHVR